MRTGFISSAALHVVIVAVASITFTLSKPMDAPASRAVEIELVPPPEASKAETPKVEAPKPEPSLPEPAKAELPKPPEPEIAKSDPPKPEPPKPEPPKPEPAKPKPSMTRAPQRHAAIPPSRQTPLGVMPGVDQRSLSGNGVGAYSFEGYAEAGARLSLDEKRRLKAQIDRCFKSPPGMAGHNVWVALEVRFRSDGTLMGEPQFVAGVGSASAQGRELRDVARAALMQCAPFTALPIERYSEWRLLQLKFTPHGLSWS